MNLVLWRTNPGGIRELEMLIERGMIACGEAVADRAADNIRPHRDSGVTEDSIYVNDSKVGEWPRPVVFVGSSSGYSFYVHEGTVDTPYIPFLAQALDSVAREFPRLLRQGAQSEGFRSKETRPRAPRAGSRRAAFAELAAIAADVAASR